MSVSLKRKEQARLAAVQALYMQTVGGYKRDVGQLIKRYTEQGAHRLNVDGKPEFAPEPETALLNRILTGVFQHEAVLEGWIDESLQEGWKRERMGPLLVAILKCAVWEIRVEAKLKPAILIDQYVTLAQRFFGEEEVGFVNALLEQQAVLREDG